MKNNKKSKQLTNKNNRTNKTSSCNNSKSKLNNNLCNDYQNNEYSKLDCNETE